MFNKLSKFIHKNLFKGLFLGGLIASGVMLVLYVVLLMFDLAFFNASIGFHVLYLLTTLAIATLGLLAKKLSYLESDNDQLFNACNDLIAAFNELEEKLHSAPVAQEAAPAVVEEPVVEAVAVEPVVEEPVVETVAVEPVVEEPVVETVAVEPVVEEPVVEAVAEKPVAAKKAPAKTTTAKKPAAKATTAKKPAAKKPVSKKESEIAALTKEVSKLSKKLDQMSK